MFEITYDTTKIEPENPIGNVEYKFRIDDKKIMKLKDQLYWRMNEGIEIAGFPEAYYAIGVSDNGMIDNPSEGSVDKSIENFKQMAELVNGDIIFINRHKTKSGFMAVIKIKKKIESLSKNDTIITLLGPNSVGKSTFVGTLTYGIIDNAKGVARNNVFRHDHEFESGKTSSTKYEILGYTKDIIVNYTASLMTSWYNIVNDSDHIVNLVDLPGENKYTRLKLSSFLIYNPHYVIFFIDSSDYQDTIEMVLKFIEVADSLDIKYLIILTKVDKITEETKSIINTDLADRIQTHLYKKTIELSSTDIEKGNIDLKNVNLLFISHLDQNDIKLVHRVLNHLAQSNPNDRCDTESPAEFMITEIIYIADIGNVLIGVLTKGIIAIGDELSIGPIQKKFEKVKVRSIHKKQIPHTKIIASNDICSIVIGDKYKITKHMILFGDIKPEKLFSDTINVVIDSKGSKIKETKIRDYVYMFMYNFSGKVIIENITDHENTIVLKLQILDNIVINRLNQKVILKMFDNFYTGITI